MTRSQGAVQRKRLFCAAALCLFRCFHRRLLEASELQSEAQVYEYSVRGKKKKGNRFKCCASDAGCRQSNSPTRFSFVIPVRTKLFNAAYCPSFCLCSCAGWRGESSASECKRSAPWPMGTERTGSHIPRMKTGGGERNDGWITR